MNGRVLHLIPALTEGGAERQLSYLGAELTRRGWAVDVALNRGGPNLERLQRAGVAIHNLGLQHNHDPRLLTRVHELVRSLTPDIVHTWLTQMDVVGGIVARLNRVPWVLSERTSSSGYQRTAKNFLRRSLGRYAAAIVANSSRGLLYWMDGAHASVSRFVVPNGLPLSEITACENGADPSLQPLKGEPFVLFVGRLSSEKDPATVLHAVEKLGPARRPRTVFCGEGPLASELALLSRSLGVEESVCLMGRLPTVWRVMKNAALMVSTSLIEGEPNAVLEAMACGCPLVVSDIPSHRDLLGDDALYAKPGDAVGFATAITSVLADPQEARQRAERARLRTIDRSVEAMAASYERIYADVIARRRAAWRGP